MFSLFLTIVGLVPDVRITLYKKMILRHMFRRTESHILSTDGGRDTIWCVLYVSATVTSQRPNSASGHFEQMWLAGHIVNNIRP